MRRLGLGLSQRRALLHPSTVAWQARVAAVSGTYTAAELAAVNAWYVEVAAAGLTDKIKRANLNVGDLNCQRACLLSAWGTASYDTIQGTPTVSSRGLILDASTKYVRTGIIPFSQSGWNGQDYHIAAQITEGNVTTGNRSIFGCWSDAGAKRLGITWTTAGTIFVDHGANGEATTTSGRSLGVLSGHMCGNALAGVGTSHWENGVNIKGDGVYGTNPTAATNAGWPSTEMNIGRADSSGMNPSCVLAGYHVGTGLTAAELRTMAEIMMKSAQSLGRQETWAAAGDSMSAAGSSQWATTLQTNYLPRRAWTRVATGGITSATLLTNMQAAIAANPCLKYRNWVVWIGTNDSSIGGWDGTNTVANVAAIRALLPHASFRVLKMVPQNRPSDYTGGSVRLVKDSVSSQWTTLYGAKAVDIVTPLVAGGTGSGQDLTDFNNGVVPSSLKATTTNTISAITKANPAVVTVPAHLASTGDVVGITGVVGMTEINGLFAYVTFPNVSTLTMVGINSTAFTTYTSGGTATVYDSTHLAAAGDTIVANTIGATLPASGSWI